jgi:small subunit ribosomal protein S3Ae
VIDANLADLNKDEDQGFRKIRLRIEDTQGKVCLTNFHGMDITVDRLRSLVKKWSTLIETPVDVRTTDGYQLRVFVLAFTARRPNQLRKTSYCMSSQEKAIRAKMTAIVTKAAACDLKDLVKKFIPELIGKEVLKACEGTYPLKDVLVRKVKVLKTPKLDLGRLMEIHEGGAADIGAPVAAPAPVEAAAE